MAIRTYDILLDSYNSTVPEPIVGRQGDKNGAVTLHVTITDRGTAVDLTGQTINLMAETAKGTAIVADNGGVTVTNATNGKFDYAIPNALWSEAGKIKRAYFSLNDADGQQTTYDLIFIVKKAVDISQGKADDYITIIDGTLRSLKEKIDDMNTDVQTVLNAYNQGDFYNKSETDDKDTATLSSAKKYADDKDTATLSSAKKYADNGDSATLANAKSYVDSGAAVSIKTFGDEVFTLSNGASWYNADAWNRLTTIELGNGYRIVQIEFALKIADYQAAKYKTIVSMPLKYAPKIDWHLLETGSGNSHVRWNIRSNGTMAVGSIMGESAVDANFWYPMSTIYITHD